MTTLTRRRFFGAGVTTVAATAVALATGALAGEAEPAAAQGACMPTLVVSPEVVAMQRLSFGPSPAAVAEFRALGSTPEEQYSAWVAQQLNPAAIDDGACDQRLAQTLLKISYTGVNEVRPLSTVLSNPTVQQLWQTRVMPDNMQWAERMRPYDEVRVATWIRAVYSKRQLFEVLVDFWHNHFNVRASSDSAIAGTWPVYDRIMRTHALGNFADFVVAVGQSVAMMYYLDNVSNRVAGGEGGNENYARELFELHTLGSDNYFKFYDQRSQIGTVSYGGEEFVAGYIDDDVYEASFAFTGWTIANGHWERPSQDNGSFLFDPNWHQGGGKRVLVRTLDDIIENRSNPVQEGYEVIRRLANHPGTARTLCTKLCRRLISDDPPEDVIEAAVATWMANRAAPDQLKRVLATILNTDACRTTFGRKVKRPLEAIWSYLRATGANLPSDVAAVNGNTGQGGYWGSIFWTADQAGHRLFGWDTPTGHPDLASYWANTNGLLRRWNMPYSLTQSWGGNVGIDIVGQTPAGLSCTQIVNFWIERLIGFTPMPWVTGPLVTFLAQGGDPNQPPRPLAGAPDWGSADAVRERIIATVQLITMSPEFNLR